MDFGNRMVLRNTVAPSWMMVSKLVHNLLAPIGPIMLEILDSLFTQLVYHLHR